MVSMKRGLYKAYDVGESSFYITESCRETGDRLYHSFDFLEPRDLMKVLILNHRLPPTVAPVSHNTQHVVVV